MRDLAIQGDGRGRGEQIRRDQPRQTVHVLEVAADRGQRGRQNRLVERPHECRQQHAKDDQQRLSMGEGLILTAGSGGIHRQACSGCELAGSALAPLPPVLKQARWFGQPAQEIARMSAMHAAPAVRDTLRVACCSAPKCVCGRREDISLLAPRPARNGRSVQCLGIAGTATAIICFDGIQVPGARSVARAHCPRRSRDGA
jgi:hypothetical protein